MRTKSFIACLVILSSMVVLSQDKAVTKKTPPTKGIKTDNINTILFQKENLGTNVNTNKDELHPLISPDGKTLYWIVSYDGVDGKLNQETWYSELDEENNWKKAKHFLDFGDASEVNVRFQSISPDGNTLLVALGFKDENRQSGLFLSEKTENGWSYPQKLSIINYDKFEKRAWSTSYLTNNKNILFLSFSISSKREEYLDEIYISFLDKNENWTEPKKLGKNINVYGVQRSFAAFLASDNITLYFANNREGGFGNCDIYYAKRLDDTWLNWSEPVNMGASINTGEWDAYYSISAKGDYAYFVSSQNTYGASDVFRVKLKEEERPNPVVLVSGKVVNLANNQPLAADIYYYSLKDGSEVGRARTNPSTGIYKIALPYGYQYSFIAKATGYYSMSNYVDLITSGEYKEMNLNIEMKPIEIGETFTINNIFFDFNKSSLKSESFFELDRVVKLLSENPSIEIELSGHTDNVGTDDYNNKLSYDRSNSVAEYLISKGIEKSRIKVEGYGKLKPIATNDTEQGRQLNRRVEFQILKK
ncbi:MAG: OmpA family protein [Ignavibacteria bacterium]|nr:OmpA family protein [Ignavibacteria bacterium]